MAGTGGAAQGWTLIGRHAFDFNRRLGSVLASHVGHLSPHTDPSTVVAGYQSALHIGAAALVIGAVILFARAPRLVRRSAAVPAGR